MSNETPIMSNETKRTMVTDLMSFSRDIFVNPNRETVQPFRPLGPSSEKFQEL
jgi:hypothetical protein